MYILLQNWELEEMICHENNGPTNRCKFIIINKSYAELLLTKMSYKC